MLFKVSFKTVSESELYEYLESSNSDCYHFSSEDGKSLKIRFLGSDSLLFYRKTSELEISGILTRNSVTRIKVIVPQFKMRIPYEVRTLEIINCFPAKISFKYQIIEDGSEMDPPIEVTIAKLE